MKINTKFAFTVTHTTALKRKISPTTMSHAEGEMIPTSRKFVRRDDTFRACQAIHGADADNDAPVLDDLLDTSISKFNCSVVVKKLLPISQSNRAGASNGWPSSSNGYTAWDLGVPQDHRFIVGRCDTYLHLSSSAKTKVEVECSVNGEWYET